ncbi:MAG: FAD-binding oxidoreductase [Saprospiraceae bacterium]|jgi:glycine/D-amino acid oxidase-like deaminating enzyme|nr:FAD-binding oxidoreductase [Saprospiraceae bacterium]
MQYSFWEKDFLEKPADITILGSGIVGLSTAISIKKRAPHCNILVLERGTHPFGASTRNAGFACFGSVSELLEDIRVMGEEACMEVVSMRYQGLKTLRQRLGDATIDYRSCGGMEVFRMKDKESSEQCQGATPFCNQLIKSALGLDNCYNVVKNTSLPSFGAQAIFQNFEGTLHPLKMMHALQKLAVSSGVRIEYGIQVDEIDQANRSLLCANQLQIGYNKLIVCTNGFSRRLLPELEVVPARNQVLITQPLPQNPLVSGYHLDKGFVYFREVAGRILIGGGRNLDPEGEMTDQFGETEQIRNYLLKILDEIYPGASTKIELSWSGILGVGPSKFPIVEWVDDHIIAGVRMGGMGVAIGSHLGEMLADQVTR